mmetsp:Transcript_34531/g.64418  ORF Transcript_34531/g.64418 Transcript_34531/m.64418 type:complete len:221 (+) Transcript_34531:245-907(+)
MDMLCRGIARPHFDVRYQAFMRRLLVREELQYLCILIAQREVNQHEEDVLVRHHIRLQIFPVYVLRGRGIFALLRVQKRALNEHHREGENLRIHRKNFYTSVAYVSKGWLDDFFRHFYTFFPQFGNGLPWHACVLFFELVFHFTKAVADGRYRVVAQHYCHLKQSFLATCTKGGGCVVAMVSVDTLCSVCQQLFDWHHGAGFEQRINVFDDVGLGSLGGM